MQRFAAITVSACAVACLALMAWNVAGTYELRRNVAEVLMQQKQLTPAFQSIRVRRTSPDGAAFVEYGAERVKGESYDAWAARLEEARQLAVEAAKK